MDYSSFSYCFPNDAADAVEGLLGMVATGLLSTDTLEGNGVEGGVDEDDDEYGW